MSPLIPQIHPVESHLEHLGSSSDRTCVLHWRQKQLLVRLLPFGNHPFLPCLDQKPWLIDCLKSSMVRIVRLDPNLGKEKISFWADACIQAQRLPLLWIIPRRNLPAKRFPIQWQIKRGAEWLLVASVLLLLSPALLLEMLASKQTRSPQWAPTWYVGERGKLFRFPGQVMRSPLRRYWQLFSVLNGSLALVGPRPHSLEMALQMNQVNQSLLNVLPGLIGPDLQGLNDATEILATTRHYLIHWSLWGDLELLFQAIGRQFRRR